MKKIKLTIPKTSVRLFSIFVASILFVASPLVNAEKQQPPPDVPAAIRPPAGAAVVLVAHASGSQVYVCQAAADGKVGWTLKTPEAELKDAKGNIIGSHFGGPSWKLNDGSGITGKAAAHVDSPEADSIPWLLVNAVDHSGKGLLTDVTSIQRVNTHGGKPPAMGCDDVHKGAEAKASYTADYYFYAPGK
jgi:hypothetical protein